MNARGLVVLAAAGMMLGGCANGSRGGAGDSIVGTWTGRAGPGDAPFSFGSVSFVGDNTYTAEARYGGNVRVQSGTWSTSGNTLRLDAGQTEREYTYRIMNGELAVTDPESGNTITLDRLRR